MPSATKESLGLGLKTLARSKPLNNWDWLELIEARKGLIMPNIDSISLDTLSRQVLPVGVGDGIYLNRQIGDIQGIFFFDESHKSPGNLMKFNFVGLTRNGSWVYIEIYNSETKGIRIHDLRYFKGVGKLEDYYQFDPEKLWRGLGKFIKDTAQKRYELYMRISTLKDIVIAEESILGLLPGSSKS